MIKYEVMKRVDTTQVDYPRYTFFIDRVMIALQPQRPTCFRKVHLWPRVDDDIFTFTDLARSLPETDYSEETLGHKILEAQLADIRDLIILYFFRCYRSSSDDKRRILLNLKSDINTTEELFKKSTDFLAEKNKRSPNSLEFHLMSLEDLLNLFSGSDADAAKAKLLALCI